jgi:hypothetical protein
MILPGVYIEVRPEGLIIPGRVTVGNLGVVGTAAKGEPDKLELVGSIEAARERFGEPDEWRGGTQDELTLVRALELAYRNGATTAWAVRATGKQTVNNQRVTTAKTAEATLPAVGGGAGVRLRATSPGDWANSLAVTVRKGKEGEQPVPVADEEVTPQGSPATFTLAHKPVVKSDRTRVSRFDKNLGITVDLEPIYDDTTAAPTARQVKIDRATGGLTFGTAPGADDKVTASYLVDPRQGATVTLAYGRTTESYTVLDGTTLIRRVNKTPAGQTPVNPTPSPLVQADPLANASKQLDDTEASLQGGSNGAANADLQTGLDNLLNVNAHIIVAAGRDQGFGDELKAHCDAASTDEVKRDRIAVVGSGVGATLDTILGHPLSSDRVIFVAPGIVATDRTSGQDVTLPGAYAAAAVAGLLAGLPAHVSPTNKVVNVGGLERSFTQAELKQLVQARVLALEARQGFRVVRGLTTSDPPFHEITTRRIVDFAKFGVRSAANPYIGLLNNQRVRGALRATVNSFLTNMVNDEMLVSYELDVTATRDEERQGIARVTMVLRPVFSIAFIRVVMFLE